MLDWRPVPLAQGKGLASSRAESCQSGMQITGNHTQPQNCYAWANHVTKRWLAIDTLPMA